MNLKPVGAHWRTGKRQRVSAGFLSYDNVCRNTARIPGPMENVMTICPVAIAVGCKKCPIVAVCPVRSVIGDYKKDGSTESGSATSQKGSDKPR